MLHKRFYLASKENSVRKICFVTKIYNSLTECHFKLSGALIKLNFKSGDKKEILHTYLLAMAELVNNEKTEEIELITEQENMI